MADHEQLDELEQTRIRLYAELATTGDFRRGSVTANYRRCGKPNCVCAMPEHPGHGPRMLWTRSVAGKTKGRQLDPDEIDKVRGEVATYERFTDLTRQVVAVNEAICEARPPDVNDDGGAGDEKGGSTAGPPPS